MPKVLFWFHKFTTWMLGVTSVGLGIVSATHAAKAATRRGNPLVSLVVSAGAAFAAFGMQRHVATVRQMNDEVYGHIFEDPERYLDALTRFRNLIDASATSWCTSCAEPHRTFVASVEHDEYSGVIANVDGAMRYFDLGLVFKEDESTYDADSMRNVHTMLSLEYRYSPLALTVGKRLVPYLLDPEAQTVIPVPVLGGEHEGNSELSGTGRITLFGINFRKYRPGTVTADAEFATAEELEQAVALLELVSTPVATK
jgi:hypothetical protein